MSANLAKPAQKYSASARVSEQLSHQHVDCVLCIVQHQGGACTLCINECSCVYPFCFVYFCVFLMILATANFRVAKAGSWHNSLNEHLFGQPA
jgi:hypothetical protein